MILLSVYFDSYLLHDLSRFTAHHQEVNSKVKWSRYRPGVSQSLGRGIALLFHDRGTRRGWVVSSTPRPHFTPGKDTVPIVQEAGWAPRPVWTGGTFRLHRDSIPDSTARRQSLYRLSYPAHRHQKLLFFMHNKFVLAMRLCWLAASSCYYLQMMVSNPALNIYRLIIKINW